ncbi:hypothetical protein SAMN04487765_3528 [Tenacibaculum sp. MAR_2010_89]|uniref:SHOCT domain-containing protein n=1 Tax=Tenacibaculum sp. MAR_2010_89 TaxID=1250198 RepID=UPI0008963FE7|nr:SHOCT domain-containing protein [Tenacibaculum sp. MAR_2010_89]SEE63996.1 hypothetical protein SAMN04487765_3528 [Tenacibaculum sp. MAR_2010_89]
MKRGHLFIFAALIGGGYFISKSNNNPLVILVTIIFSSILLIIGSVILIRDNRKKREGKIKQSKMLLNQLENFSATKKIVQPWGVIAIDEENKKIAIKEEIGSLATYSYDDIMRTEILQDGEITYRKSSKVGQIIDGLILADISGAIFGGVLPREGSEVNEVKAVDLKIVIKDVHKPSFNLRFFDAHREKEKRGENFLADSHEIAYEKALSNLKNWKDILEIIIDKSNSEKKHTSNNISSVSDELIKLNDLKEKGILSEEEFVIEKKKVLK